MSEKCPKEKWVEAEESVVNALRKHTISDGSDMWYKIICPDCGAENWVLMNQRFEACRCHKCPTIFWVSEKIYDDYKTELTLSLVFDYDANWIEDICDGLEKPN